MLRLRGRSSGFTLLELIIVVIVIGILASIALPKYLQVAEKGRIAEAKAILGAIRAAQMRYLAKAGHYTATIGDLDFTGTKEKYFTTSIAGVLTTTAVADSDTTIVGYCTRNNFETINGPAAQYVISITAEGNMTSADATAQKLI